MRSSTRECARVGCKITFKPKALAPLKRFCSTNCRTAAGIDRRTKLDQLDILRLIDQFVGTDYLYVENVIRMIKKLETELE